MKVSVSTKGLKRNDPSMDAPGMGDVVRPLGNANVYGADRHASKFADAMAPFGGPAKDEKELKHNR